MLNWSTDPKTQIGLATLQKAPSNYRFRISDLRCRTRSISDPPVPERDSTETTIQTKHFLRPCVKRTQPSPKSAFSHTPSVLLVFEATDRKSGVAA